jgi:hypothetical protein
MGCERGQSNSVVVPGCLVLMMNCRLRVPITLEDSLQILQD